MERFISFPGSSLKSHSSLHIKTATSITLRSPSSLSLSLFYFHDWVNNVSPLLVVNSEKSLTELPSPPLSSKTRLIANFRLMATSSSTTVVVGEEGETPQPMFIFLFFCDDFNLIGNASTDIDDRRVAMTLIGTSFRFWIRFSNLGNELLVAITTVPLLEQIINKENSKTILYRLLLKFWMAKKNKIWGFSEQRKTQN